MTRRSRQPGIGEAGDRQVVLVGAAIVMLMLAVTLHGWWSMSRVRFFSPDSMNYVDVARNLAGGKGLVQSTLGFNIFEFPADRPLLPPYTTQAPLYPVAIALFSFLGLSFAGAALLIPILGYGGLLLAGYLLMRRLHDRATALIAVAVMISSYSLHRVSAAAWTETPGLLLAVLSLVAAAAAAARGGAGRWGLLAGLLAGLAFATRYGLIVAFPAGLAYLTLRRGWRPILPAAVGYLGGFLAVALPLCVRNWILTGYLLGFRTNPEPVPVAENLTRIWRYVLGEHVASDSDIQIWFLVTTAVGACAWLLFRRGWSWRRLAGLLFGSGRFVLLFWGVGYALLAGLYLIYIDGRLLSPAILFVALFWAALFTRATGISTSRAAVLVLLAAGLQAGLSVHRLTTSEATAEGRSIEESARLGWVARNLASGDLVVGDDTVDISFLLDRPTVSFSPFPFSRIFRYDDLLTVARTHCRAHRRIVLIIRKRGYSQQEWADHFGSFVSDLVNDRAAGYPPLRKLAELDDAVVFEAGCDRLP